MTKKALNSVVRHTYKAAGELGTYLELVYKCGGIAEIQEAYEHLNKALDLIESYTGEYGAMEYVHKQLERKKGE